MLEIIIIGLLGFLILLFFHNQSSHEFKINQVEFREKIKLENLFAEKVPLVVKGVPPVPSGRNRMS